MRLIYHGLTCLAVAIAMPAMAADVASGTVQLGASNAVQLGRLSRQGTQQDWTGGEAFPGTINPATPYAYTNFMLPFAANAYQPIYYDITFDDEATDLFASAYLDSYDPTNLAVNWLGDAGSSGNYSPGDPRFFDVVVPTGHSLVLVINSTAGVSLTSAANYLVSAFSDTEYNENFLTPAVPEPSTWSMMLIGFAAIGSAVRRRRNVTARVSFAT